MEGGDGGREEGGKSVPEGGDWSGPWSPEKGMGEGGRGTPRAGTDGALASTSAAGGAGSQGPFGAGAGAGVAVPGAEGGGSRGKVSPLASSPAPGRAPRARSGLGGSRVPSTGLAAVPGLGGEPASGGDLAPRPSSLLSSALSGESPAGAQPWNPLGAEGLAGREPVTEEDPERTPPARDPEQGATREGIGR